MEIDDLLFGEQRKQVLQYWEEQTNRDCRPINDDMNSSFECKWQDRARDDFGYNHISIFCSLGEWANNISDILKDEIYDKYIFQNDDQSQALFRYYTRLLLVVSEMLSDFSNIVKMMSSFDTTKAREFLSDNKRDVNSLLEFINKVCKHKVNNFHQCNHHLPILFEDQKENPEFYSPISVKNINLSNPDAILMPKLNFIIQIVLNCYARIDELFDSEIDKFKIICEKYNGEVLSPESD